MYKLPKRKMRDWMNRIILEDINYYCNVGKRYPSGYTHMIDEYIHNKLYEYINKNNKPYIHSSIFTPIIYELYLAWIEIQSSFKTNFYPINGKAKQQWYIENLPWFTLGVAKRRCNIYAPAIWSWLWLFKKDKNDVLNKSLLWCMWTYNAVTLSMIESWHLHKYILENKDWFLDALSKQNIIYRLCTN